MSKLPVQRRFERIAIRTQARLEGGMGDRWIPAAVGIVLTAILVRLSLDRLASYDHGADLAGYTQSVWLISEGFEPRASMFGTDVHVLELHWSFILYPLGLLATFVSPATMLLAAQGTALGVAVIPLWRLARNVANLRVGASSALIIAFALHPATHRLGTEDFHPGVLAVPAIIALAYFGLTKKWFWYWVCVAIALACRADLGLAVGTWGFLLIGDGERRIGMWTLGIGWLWSLGFLLVGQPLIATPGGIGPRSGYDGQALGDVVLDSVRRPFDSIQNLAAQDNMVLIVTLLAPVIFLPLLSLRYLLPAVPLAGLYLVTSTAADPFAERASMLLAFVMIAATFALNRLGNMGVDRVFLDVRLLTTLVAASVLLFAGSSPASPYERPWTWSQLTETDREIAEAVNLVDEDTPIRASPAALPALAERPWLYPLDVDQPLAAIDMFNPDITLAVLVVEGQVPLRTNENRETFTERMASQEFAPVFTGSDDEVTLFTR